jgi:hypothetical protein
MLMEIILLFIDLFLFQEGLINITPWFQEALKWVTDQPAWQRSEGRDHIIPVHHPWSFKSVRRFVKKAIWLLPDMDSTGNWYGIIVFQLPLYLGKLLACIS